MPAFRSRRATAPDPPLLVEATRLTPALIASLPVSEDAAPGDWLVTTPDGHSVTTTDAIFNRDFQEAPHDGANRP